MVEDELLEVLADRAKVWMGYKIPETECTVKFLQIAHLDVVEEGFEVYDGDLANRKKSSESYLHLMGVVGDEKIDAIDFAVIGAIPLTDTGALRIFLDNNIGDFLHHAAEEFYVIKRDNVRIVDSKRGLSKEKGKVIIEPIVGTDFNLDEIIRKAEEETRKIIENPKDGFITETAITGTFYRVIKRIATSEGTEIRTNLSYGGLGLVNAVENIDGHKVTARAPDTIVRLDCGKSIDPFWGRIGGLVEELDDFRYTITIPSDNYIVLMMPGTSGIWFHEIIAAHLVSGLYFVRDESSELNGNWGKKIFSDLISMKMVPRDKNGFGYHTIDDEGVVSKEIEIMRNGILTDVLTDRYTAFRLCPKLRKEYGIRRMFHSNGHAFIEPGEVVHEPRMSNVVVNCSKRVSVSDLEIEAQKRARKRVDDYYFIAESVSGGRVALEDDNVVINLYKLWAVNPRTGERRLVENPRIIDSFSKARSGRRILMAGDDHQWTPGFCGADSGHIPVGHYTPSLLVAETNLVSEKEVEFRPTPRPPDYKRAIISSPE